jgi:hypothetical protein
MFTFSLMVAWPILIEFIETGLVPRFPTTILATGMMLLAFLFLGCGLILDTVTHGRREMRRLHYLMISPLQQQSFCGATEQNKPDEWGSAHQAG